jgi:hypothetical protein
MTKSHRVYPVEGRFLIDVPHVEHDCDDPRCVESGAFTDKSPAKAAAKSEAPENPGPLDSQDKE